MKTVLLLSISAASLLLTSCNTFIGMGRDIKEGYNNIRASSSNRNSGGNNDQYGAPVY